MSEWQRITLAGAIAGLAVAVAAGPPRPRRAPAGWPFEDGCVVHGPGGCDCRAVVIPIAVVDDLEAFDASDVLEAHGVETA